MKKLLILAGLLSASAGYAQSLGEAPAAAFYRMTLDARAAGMGNVKLATTADANAIFSNLAKLPSLLRDNQESTSRLYSVGYKQFNAAQITYGSYSYADDNGSYFSAGFRHTDGRRPSVQPFPSNDYNDWDVEAGLARLLSNTWSVSFTAKLLQSQLTKKSDEMVSALNADIAMYYDGRDELGEGFNAGFILSSLGPKLAYSADNTQFLPTNFGVGIARSWTAPATRNRLTISFETNMSLSPKQPGTAGERAHYQSMTMLQGLTAGSRIPTISGGGELALQLGPATRDMIIFRSGYFIDMGSGYYSGCTGGIGLEVNRLHMDIAYCINPGMNPSPTTHTLQFGLSTGF